MLGSPTHIGTPVHTAFYSGTSRTSSTAQAHGEDSGSVWGHGEAPYAIPACQNSPEATKELMETLPMETLWKETDGSAYWTVRTPLMKTHTHPTSELQIFRLIISSDLTLPMLRGEDTAYGSFSSLNWTKLSFISYVYPASSVSLNNIF